MKTNKTLVVFFVVLIVLLVILGTQPSWLRRSIRSGSANNESPPAPNSTQAALESKKSAATTTETNKAKVLAAMSATLLTPIAFYGKVLDQHGGPVPHAHVEYGLLDRFLASGSTGKSIADGNGFIKLSGIRGAVITVGVSKPGYYSVDEKSAMSFAYGTPPDDYRQPAPTAESPAVFLLHKRGHGSPLISVKLRNHIIPKDGTPIRVQISTGVATPAGELQVEAWTGEREPNGPRFYEWRCRVSIPGGGLIERKSSLEFEAPKAGYLEFDEVSRTNERLNWTPRFEKEYFIRTKDNRFARTRFFFTSDGEHFFWLETHLNPEPGNRNLEYDENNGSVR